MFTRQNIYALIRELLWWAITGMLVYAVLYPVVQKLYYKHYAANALFIFLSVTYFRWSVTFRSLPFFRPGWVRFLVFAVNVSLFVFVLQQEQQFLMYIDNYTMEDFGFPKVIMYDHVKQGLFKYLYREIVFFATASLITIAALNTRLLIAWWQYYKHRADTLLE